ncbi:MAG TPA: SsrA-binding protein SmpB [Anaerolineae bacterium]|nr:SsrA-binding protein SmpB [Anaerolineae bacterium]
MEKVKTIAQNKKARHNYYILSTYEVGIALQGTEVKSLRDGRLNFKDSYARVSDGELWLIDMHISPYDKGNIHNHDPLRKRKLLMHSFEIERLRRSTEEKGLTIVPLSIYLKNGKVKVEIGLAKGKHLYDKREDKISRDARREIDSAQKKGTTRW